MKYSTSFAIAAAACTATCSAFQRSSPAFVVRQQQRRTTSALAVGGGDDGGGMDMSGNTWKPKSETMGSTDTGDYFPDAYEGAEVDFTEGMLGSQSGKGDRKGPALPGMENLGADAVMMGGIDEASEIPAGMEFVPSSVPDGEFQMNVPASSSGQDLNLDVKPICMGYEDFYAAFAPGSHQSLRVGPVAGRMDRRGGVPSPFTVRCEPNGQAGDFEGDLVINLPEDNSKICYKIKVHSF